MRAALTIIVVLILLIGWWIVLKEMITKDKK
jgi:hypothetical protein